MAVSVVSFSFSRAAQPEAQGPLCWMMAFFIASYQHLLWTPTDQGPFGMMWLYLPHLLSNSTETANSTLTQLSYILFQRPFDFWNRMFNRHQAEITVMQFRGNSLPVRQSIRVSWDFFSLSHFVSQFPPTRFPLLTAIGMCHFLPVHHLEWHFGPGRRSKYNKERRKKI